MISGSSLGWSWVFAIGVLCISCLGIYAGFSEKDLALKIVRTDVKARKCWRESSSLIFRVQFAGFMGVGMLIMLIFGIIVVVSRNKVIELSVGQRWPT